MVNEIHGRVRALSGRVKHAGKVLSRLLWSPATEPIVLHPLSQFSAPRQMSRFPRSSTDQLLGDIDEICPETDEHTSFASTGHHVLLCGPGRRAQVEQSLLRKLDIRVFFLVFVYTLNCVSHPIQMDYISWKAYTPIELERTNVA